MKRRALCVLALVCGIFPAAGGCQRTLFSDSDPYTQSRLRYWGSDSARETTESRKRAADMGFGWPMGAGYQ